MHVLRDFHVMLTRGRGGHGGEGDWNNFRHGGQDAEVYWRDCRRDVGVIGHVQLV